MTAEQLEYYILGQIKSPIYDDCVKLYNRLKCHADGEYPAKLIDERRPSESEHIKKYRKTIYAEITKETFQSVFTSLSKIRRSSDWRVMYDEDSEVSSIADEERLKDYCEKYFPYYSSVTNWAFTELLKQYLIDSNGVIMVLPINQVVENEYLKPFPFIFNSDQVIEFKEGLAVLEGEKVKKIFGQEMFESDVYYVVDNVQVERFEKIRSDSGYTSVSVFVHGLSKMPVFKIGGILKDKKYNQPIYESRINTLAPRLDEVAREYSDLQAEVVQHIYSEKWIWATQDCKACGHDGLPKGFIKKDGIRQRCNTCGGHGTVSASPYDNIVLRPNSANKNLGEQEFPTPPAGYIQKDVEIVKIQDERIDKHVYKALASINMQFLVETPLNQSGTAKEVDRDELNNFVYSIAEDIVGIMDKVYWYVNEYRYMLVVSDVETREDMLPQIEVPEHYDLLSAQYLIEERKNAKDAGINPVLINAMDLELAGKMFITNPKVIELLSLVQELDPIPSKSEDEKMVLLSNRGVTELDYIISSNIQPFVNRAVRENKGFADFEYSKKYSIIEGYAKEKQKQTSVKDSLEMPTDSNQQGNRQQPTGQQTE